MAFRNFYMTKKSSDRQGANRVEESETEPVLPFLPEMQLVMFLVLNRVAPNSKLWDGLPSLADSDNDDWLSSVLDVIVFLIWK